MPPNLTVDFVVPRSKVVRRYFAEHYKQNQAAYDQKIEKILEGILDEFERQVLTTLSGESLNEFIHEKLVDPYQRDNDSTVRTNYRTERERERYFEKITENDLDKITRGNLMWENNVYTPLSFGNERSKINFLAIVVMTQTKLSRPQFKFDPTKEQGTSLVVDIETFCDRARRFFGIELRFTPTHAKVAIAGGQNRSIPRMLGCEIQITHVLQCLEKVFLNELESLYAQLLEIIFKKNECREYANTEEKRLNTIFLLSFLIGSNPQKRKGGAFMHDTMLQILLITAGFSPINKNPLQLTEVKLLCCFGEDDKNAWDEPAKAYRAAISGETNAFFHPGENSDDTLAEFLQAHVASSFKGLNDFFTNGSEDHLKIILNDLRKAEEANVQSNFFRMPAPKAEEDQSTSSLNAHA